MKKFLASALAFGVLVLGTTSAFAAEEEVVKRPPIVKPLPPIYEPPVVKPPVVKPPKDPIVTPSPKDPIIIPVPKVPKKPL